MDTADTPGAAPSKHPGRSPRWLRDGALSLLIWVCAVWFYGQWQRAEVTDSKYTLLASHALWHDGTQFVDRYLGAERAQAARLDPATPRLDQHAEPGYPYQLQVLPRDASRPGAPRILLWYPRLPALLGAPLVPILAAQGLVAVDGAGAYDPAAEARMQLAVAAWLCALCVALVFLLAVSWLPVPHSMLLAFAFGAASPLFSVGSRALWTHDWGIAAGLGVCLHLVRVRLRGLAPNPLLTGSLLAVLYLCRPAFAVEILATMAYLVWADRRAALQTGAVGALWALGFGVWSHSLDGDWLPSYYRHTHLGLGHFWVALYGSLLSPGRGLLVYTPLLVPTAAVLILWRQAIAWRGLVWWAVACTLGHAVMLALYPNWWGGHSFGARLMMDTLPWTALLVVAAWAALRAAPALSAGKHAAVVLGFAAAMALGAYIHWCGVAEPKTFAWNTWPRELSEDSSRIFDWRLPQFMAGKWPQPPPDPVPVLAAGAQLEIGKSANDLYLLEGWSLAEGQFRWTDGPRARIAWQPSGAPAKKLALALRPYLDTRPQGKGPKSQRIRISVNGALRLERVLGSPAAEVLQVDLPPQGPGEPTVLTLELPDAAAPVKHRNGTDTRQLGMAVYALRLAPP